MNSIHQPNTCSQCGAQLSPLILEGFCPRCIARLTFELPEEGSLRAAPGMVLDFGDYKLLEEIGRGGMGLVYKARQLSLDRVVALKMILAGRFASGQDVERFKAEAQAAAALRHPAIVAIHEIGEVEGQHYFTMDHIEGCSLDRLISDSQFSLYDFKRSARWVKIIAEAIHSAHQHGVLHRDLKPSNVFIDQHDQPRITDFGLAKRFGVPPSGGSASESSGAAGLSSVPPAEAGTSNLTLSGQPIGSPSFMPPEQATGKRNAIGPHSDVYSMGALLYYLLTARAPFAAETIEATLSQVVQNDPVPPHALNPSVSRDLETICLKCLEKEPARRYGSAQQLADELERFLQDKPILARPVARPEKLWRWGRRNPRVAVLAASLLVVFVAGIVGVVWQWRRAENHARTETQERQRLEEALTRYELEKIEELFSADDTPSALARLARVMRQNPTNRVAAARLLSALMYRSFALPVAPPLTHEAAVLSARFSPDGQRVVTASEDGTARVWDAATGRRLFELPHEAIVRHAEFSLDGQRIVTASEDSTARVWDARTGEPVTPPLRHASKVRRGHFSPDGGRVATASADGTARVWDSRTGEPVTPPLQHAEYVNEAAFSPDGQWVVTASDDDSACVWDARTGKRLAAPLQHRYDVWSARFSPDGRRIVTASADHTARVWDALTRQPVAAALSHKDLVNFATFSPDGTKVVTASWDDTARVWNAATAEPVTPPLQFDSDVLYAEFSSDGQRVFASADSAARVWDAETGAPLTELILHQAPLRHLGGFSPDCGRVVTASFDRTAIVWDARPGAALPRRLAGHSASGALACSPDGRWVAAARGADFTAHIWEVSTGEIIAGPLRHGGFIATTQFSPDGWHLLTACHDGKARIWDVRSGELAIPPLPHQGHLRSARFSRNGRRIVTAPDDKTARIWDAVSGQEIIGPLRHGAYVHWAEFSPDDRKIVTASGEAGDRTARVWDAATGEPLTPPLRHELGVQSAYFSPDGRSLLTASLDGTARLWDVGTGQPAERPLTHRGHVYSAEFSPDGRRIVTASADRTARVWDAHTGEPLTEPLKHNAPLQIAHFSPDGTRVVTVSDEPITRIWDAASGHLLSEPLRHEAAVWDARFLPDGNRLVTVAADELVRLWDTPSLRLPVPGWLPELAEALAVKRLDVQGRAVPMPASRLVELRQRFESSHGTDFYTRWATWFFADRETRAASPFTQLTAPEQPGRSENSVK